MAARVVFRARARNFGGRRVDKIDVPANSRRPVVGGRGLSSDIVAVAAGEGYHVCALTASGGVKCWGQGPSGQLGDGKTTASDVPVDVVGL